MNIKQGEVQDKVYNYMPNEYQEQNNQKEGDEEQIDPNEQELMKIYEIVDLIPLTRPKKNITRDFADGVLVAEIIKYFIPKIVELHNYISTNNMKSKRENWGTLNRKVLKRLGLKLNNSDIESIINFTPGFIEMILQKVFNKLYENGIDVQEVINKGGNYKVEENLNIGNINYNKNNDQKYNQIEEEFKLELLERDNIIEELKVALDETEKNLKISEENKKILNHQLEVLKNKVRELGLY